MTSFVQTRLHAAFYDTIVRSCCTALHHTIIISLPLQFITLVFFHSLKKKEITQSNKHYYYYYYSKTTKQ